MSHSFTALADRQMAAEAALREGGYHHEADACRAAWNHAATTALVPTLDYWEAVVLTARAHPRRFVVPAGEAVAVEEVDIRAAWEASKLGLLSPAAVAACRASRTEASRALNARKGGEQH
jgi:hypothetical protein